MPAFIARRLVATIISLVLISVGVFGLTRLTPGSPVDLLVTPARANAGTPAYLALMRHRLGLDRPLYIQYLDWLRDILHGQFGTSYVSGTSVSGVIGTHVGPTLLLMGTGLLIGLFLSLLFGLIAAMKRDTWADHAITAASLSLVAVPSFFTAIMAIYIFSVDLGWFPTSGMSTLGAPSGLVDHVRHLVLPACVLGVGTAGWMSRYVRSSIIAELSSDYLRTALAKGASPTRALLRHALRNALGPIITVIALTIPTLIAGSAFVETIFAWPGLGRLAVSSATSEDYPVILALVLIVAVAVLLSNLLGEILHMLADKRVALSVGRSTQ